MGLGRIAAGAGDRSRRGCGAVLFLAESTPAHEPSHSRHRARRSGV